MTLDINIVVEILNSEARLDRIDHYKCVFIWYSLLVKMYRSRHLIETGWKAIEIALYGFFDGHEARRANLFNFTTWSYMVC